MLDNSDLQDYNRVMGANIIKIAVVRVIGFLAVMGLAVFASAGTFNYWQGWAYISQLLLLMLLITAYLWKNDRKLLERRLDSGPWAEKQKSQRLIQSLGTLAFLGMIVVPALDHRFGWSYVHTSLVIIGFLMILLAYVVMFFVFKQNVFASAIIKVEKNQKVISTGLYGVIRHPMYSGIMFMMVGTPIALGSWWGLLGSLWSIIFVIIRLLDEEKYLVTNLEGYAEYRKKVRYRLIPFVF